MTRRWCLCLYLGAVLLLLSLDTDYLLPATAWLHSIFLLRHARREQSWRAVWLVSMLGSLVWLCLTATIASGSVALTFAASATLMTVPFALDLWLADTHPLAKLLVFPLARAGMEYLFTIVTGFGNFGSLAESVASGTSLLQIASVTGSYGVSFLVAWPASALNTAWEAGWSPAALRRTVLPCALGLAAVALGGEVRLAATALGPAVRVAGLHPGKSAEGRPEEMNQELLTRTDQEAAAGAKIIVWSEEAGQGEVLGGVAELARRRGVFVAAAFRSAGPHNQLALIGPEGALRWRVDKTHPTPWELREGIRPGDGRVVVSENPRLAGVICYDLDFPPLVRRAAAAGADLLLVAAHDWPGFARLHARKAVIRAVESGLPLVRATGSGISLALDPLGRTVASASGPANLVAQVPLGRVWTVYAAAGDAFAWLCLAALAMLATRRLTA
jgi:apolipoprotein N-acyltransferase